MHSPIILKSFKSVGVVTIITNVNSVSHLFRMISIRIGRKVSICWWQLPKIISWWMCLNSLISFLERFKNEFRKIHRGFWESVAWNSSMIEQKVSQQSCFLSHFMSFLQKKVFSSSPPWCSWEASSRSSSTGQREVRGCVTDCGCRSGQAVGLTACTGRPITSQLYTHAL